MKLERIETFAPRTVVCNTCENKYSDCYDCNGEGEWPATCCTCGVEKPLNEYGACAECFGLVEIEWLPNGGMLA